MKLNGSRRLSFTNEPKNRFPLGPGILDEPAIVCERVYVVVDNVFWSYADGIGQQANAL